MDAATGRKIRKPYTITKSRESWSELEHEKFLEALQLFDRDWRKIEAFVGTKTVIQIRSHAQKYFLKVQKNGTGEHLPPPRPKRKSAQPYPHKADARNDTVPTLPVFNESPSSSGSVPEFPDSPNFAAVYGFIGSVFDPETTGHLDRLVSLPQIDRAAVVLLMGNLAKNLASLDIKEHLPCGPLPG